MGQVEKSVAWAPHYPGRTQGGQQRDRIVAMIHPLSLGAHMLALSDADGGAWKPSSSTRSPPDRSGSQEIGLRLAPKTPPQAVLAQR
jgi:hypothetical protein